MLVLKIKEKSFIYSHHKNIYQPLFISTLWLSGSAGVEAELYPDYRNHSRRSPQFTTYCNLHFPLLSAPYCKGSRGINNKSRKNRTDICIYNIHLCCCRAAGAVPWTTEVFISLCANFPSVGERQHQNVPKSNPLGSAGPPNATAPTGEHLLAPPPPPNRSRAPTPRGGEGGWDTSRMDPPLRRSPGRRRRGERTTSVRCRVFSAPCASSSCVFYLSFCWRTWSRTTVSLLGVQS